MAAVLNLNASSGGSGSQVTNVQRELNSMASFAGKSLNSASADLPSWTSNDVGASSDDLFNRADATSLLFNGDAASGHTHDGTDGQGPQIDLTTSVTGELPVANIADTVPRWEKYSVDASAFTASGTTEDIELFSLPAKGVIENIIIKHDAAFSGSAIVSYTIDIGPSSDFTKYINEFDVFQTVAASSFDAIAYGVEPESFSSAISIRARATASGDGVDGASAGSFEVWIKRSDLE